MTGSSLRKRIDSGRSRARERSARGVVLLLAVLAMLVATPQVAAASAPGGNVIAASGGSTFTSYPGLAARVISNSILPFPVDGSTIAGIQNLFNWSQFGMSMHMPLLGGNIVAAPGATEQLHDNGGVGFVNWSNGFKWVTVSHFDLTWTEGPTPQGQLVAEIDNDPGHRITLFQLNFANASQSLVGQQASLSDVGLVLTPIGAATLNGALGTSTFIVGETCGTFDASFAID